MRVVGIKVRDGRAYKRIVRELEELNIPFINLNRVSSADDVMVLSDEPGEGVFVGRNVKKAIRECVRAYTGELRELIIGIDPGPKPGIAVFGDEKLIYSCVTGSPEKAVAFVKKAIDVYDFRSCVVRIGNGAKVYRNRIINGLLPMRVEMVDERRTSRRHDDVEAAKEIAFLKGKVIKEPVEQDFEEGELREIQNQSRSLSGVTISRDLAKEVAEGRIDMERAIKKQKEVQR